MKKFNNLTDEQLAMLYMNGDNQAFDELLERNKSKIFSFIMFMVGDEDLANDIFQDTFVKVVIRLQEGKYKPTGQFGYWLMTIAHNVVLDHFRRGVRTVKYGDNRLPRDAAMPDIFDNCREAEIVNNQVLTDVKRLMDRLPNAQKEVIYMRFYQSLSFKEIAEITNVSINTALGRMRYAIINMRKMAKNNNIFLDLA